MHGNSRYLTPIDLTNGLVMSEAPHGEYTLIASTTYAYILPSKDTAFTSIDITGYTSAAVITSATIQDTNHKDIDVPDTSVIVGEWKNEKPTQGYVACDGTGWSVTTCVVAAAGSGVGGALWHVAETGASRTRLLVVVGATGGLFRVSAAGK